VSRSTYLQLAADCCPRAVDHAEAGVPTVAEHYAVGNAAHEVLEGLARGVPAATTVERLLSIGREHVDPMPPLPAGAVYEGRDLALRWASVYGVPSGGEAEVAWRFGEGWVPDPDGDWFGCRIDVVSVLDEEDEDGYPSRVVLVRDYKSSWQADAGELDTIQRRAQAVAAWSMYPDATAIRVEVGSLRRMEVYGRTIPLDEDGVALLTGWRDDLDVAIRSLRHRGPDGRRLARPGAGCGGCAYVRGCDAAAARWGDDLPGVLAEWGTAKARTAALEAVVKAAVANGAVDAGGWRVAMRPTETRAVIDGATAAALATMLRAYGIDGERLDEAAEAWAASTGGEMSVTALEKLAKALHPGRVQATARAEWLAARLRTTLVPRLAVEPTEP
jgi:hypothetical protein